MYDMYPDDWQGQEPDVEYPAAAEPPRWVDANPWPEPPVKEEPTMSHTDLLHAIDRDPDTTPLTRWRVRRLLMLLSLEPAPDPVKVPEPTLRERHIAALRDILEDDDTPEETRRRALQRLNEIRREAISVRREDLRGL